MRLCGASTAKLYARCGETPAHVEDSPGINTNLIACGYDLRSQNSRKSTSVIYWPSQQRRIYICQVLLVGGQPCENGQFDRIPSDSYIYRHRET